MIEHLDPVTSVYSYGTRFRENGCFSIPKVKGFGKKSMDAFYGMTSLTV